MNRLTSSSSVPRPRLVRRGVVAGLAAAALGLVSLGSAEAVTGPPTPTTKAHALPTPRATVTPELAVGGPRLASMGLIADLPPGVPAPPRLRDVSWVLADLDSGAIIAAKAPHARLLPASTLKTLTALALIPKVPASERIVASQSDANADGTRVGIVPGLPYTAGSLFQALLMASGNDAAYALARAAGGRDATLAQMNDQAAFLGAHDTVAKDPAGLDAPGETSSAYDLALIGRAALQLKEFRTYVATKQASFPGRADAKTKKRSSYKINNHNRLLYNYSGTIGVKNGYTVAAHHTFISAVSRGGKRYLLTEMYGLDTSWRPQAAMYNWAFRYGGQARPVGQLVEPGTVTTPPTPATPSPGIALPGVPPGDALARAAAAAAVPTSQLLDGRLSPWVGVAGLAAALLLVALLGTRRRRVVRQVARHRRR